jgi:hypothetical protein
MDLYIIIRTCIVISEDHYIIIETDITISADKVLMEVVFGGLWVQ